MKTVFHHNPAGVIASAVLSERSGSVVLIHSGRACLITLYMLDIKEMCERRATDCAEEKESEVGGKA